MKNYLLREALADDAPKLQRLLGELGYAELGENHVRKRIGDWAGDANSHVLVAECAGTIVGLASLYVLPLFHLAAPWGRITALVVDPLCQGKGVGTLLVRRLESFARERGCSAIEVTSREQRLGAHAFYARLGYELYTGRRFLKKL